MSSAMLTLVPRETVEAIKGHAYLEIDMLGLAYHNRAHTEDRVVPAAEEYSREAKLSDDDTQLLILAAVGHDFGHAGSTYRQLTPGSRDNISNEEFAASHMLEIASPWYEGEKGEILKSLIHATSFGQGNRDNLPSEHADSLYRPYKPETKLEKLLAFADVSNYRWGLDSFIKDNLNLLVEGGKATIPVNFETFLSTRLLFLSYVQQKLNDVKPFFSEDFSSTLQHQLDGICDQIKNLKDRDEVGYARHQGAFETIKVESEKEAIAG